jgi:hypothetical protein
MLIALSLADLVDDLVDEIACRGEERRLSVSVRESRRDGTGAIDDRRSSDVGPGESTPAKRRN